MWKRKFRGAHTSPANRQRNGSTTGRITHSLRRPPLNMTLPALALLLLLLAFVAPAWAAPGDDSRAPDLWAICQIVRVPVGNKVSFHGFGVGVQIYRWNGTSWIFVEPEATLFANAGDDGEVAIHFGGPTWQSNSGSKVVGKVLQHCPPRTPTPFPGCCSRRCRN